MAKVISAREKIIFLAHVYCVYSIPLCVFVLDNVCDQIKMKYVLFHFTNP
jgi:hypothetical protein